MEVSGFPAPSTLPLSSYCNYYFLFGVSPNYKFIVSVIQQHGGPLILRYCTRLQEKTWYLSSRDLGLEENVGKMYHWNMETKNFNFYLFYLYHFSFVFSDGVLKVVQGLDSTGLGRRCPKSKLKMGLSSRAFHLKLLNYPGYTSKPASSFGCLPRVVQCGWDHPDLKEPWPEVSGLLTHTWVYFPIKSNKDLKMW